MLNSINTAEKALNILLKELHFLENLGSGVITLDCQRIRYIEFFRIHSWCSGVIRIYASRYSWDFKIKIWYRRMTMCNRERTDRKFIILCGITFGVMLLLNFLTPLTADDFFFSFSCDRTEPVRSFGELISSLRYMKNIVWGFSYIKEERNVGNIEFCY